VIEIGKLSKEIFATLKAFNYDLIMYDGDGNIVHEPEDARRYFDRGEDLLVTLYEDGENSSVTLTRSQKIQVTEILSLVTTLKNITNKYALIWNLRMYGGQIKPTNFSRAIVGEAREEFMDLTENMYGTSKSSYLKLENARLIVKHSARVDEDVFGARSRRIDRIYVENEQQERFLLPTNQLLPSRAMVQHVNHGGTISDEIGMHIDRMARAYRDLGSCIRHVRQYSDVLPEGAQGVRESASGKRKDMRRMFERLFRNYAKSSVDLMEGAMLLEVSDDAIGERVERLRGMLCAEGVAMDEAMLEGIACYIEPRIEETQVVDEYHDVASDDLRNSVVLEHLAWLESFDPDVIIRSTVVEQACEGDEEDCEDEGDLTREDMLLPDASSPDLKREVAKKRPNDHPSNVLMDSDD